MNRPIILSETDRTILESYKILIEGLANYLGNSYELVLHSLESYDHSVIKIINGYHTGRSEGAPITDLAIKMLEKIESEEHNSDYYAYISKNRKGEPLKSTTIAIRGENGRIIGLLCMNFYLNTPYIDIIQALGINQTLETNVENFIDKSENTIVKTIKEVRDEISSNHTIPRAQKNKMIVARLHRMNIFQMKDAVDTVAKELGISKNTVYLHLRNMEK